MRRAFFSGARGFALPGYLVLLLIIGGIALLISGAVMDALRMTHGDVLNDIQGITGGGF